MTRPPLYISWFDDNRGGVSYYLDRVRSLDVPKPTERLIPLTETVGFTEEVDAIKSVLDEFGWNRAFIKTEYKAAVADLQRGSFILEPTREHIEHTVETLLTQNAAQDWPHGEYLVVREWIDLNFCLQQSHSCHPEVRYFIADGKVIGRTPTTYDGQRFTCTQQYTHLSDVLEESTPPDELAEQVANEFPEASWGVDFAMDTNGDWYFIEMNFNGVYWNEEHEKWWDMCGQGDNKPFGPLWTHGAALPDLTND